jgi:DNA-binding IclR family transcriptional regulator
MNKVHSIKSLNKAFDILDAFLIDNRDLSLTEIAKITGINRPTATRIVSNLVQRGYLRQLEKRGKYALGLVFLNFSGAVKRDIKLRDIAGPYLLNLSTRVDETIIIGYGNGVDGIFTETFHTQRNRVLKVVPDEGANLPLHCTCLGKIFLADLSGPEMQNYFDKKQFQRFTLNTLTDIEKLKSQLNIIKQDGLAYDNEEYAQGVLGVGAGIRNNEGRLVGAIAMVAPSARLTFVKIKGFAPEIKACASEISAELGYKPGSYNPLPFKKGEMTI